jgi:4-amino-4-deoxy-L-arabinose transferase-like glycosyltransferase
MLLLLPLVAAVVIFGIVGRWSASIRHAFLVSITCWGCCLAVVTEVLGALHALTRFGVALAWLVVVLLGLGTRAVMRGRPSNRPNPPWRPELPRLQSLEGAALLAIVTILALVGVTALVSPPNTWDVMDYHMPRVVHWIQRKSLAYYPTHYCPQLFYPPFAEWTILHLQLLTGTDRFANLVQWVSFAGCILGASYVAELLGAKRRGQYVAALLCATLPEAVLAASGSKNDLVCALWVVTAVAFALRLARSPAWGDTVFLGLSLGLAILTKGTAYFFAPGLLAGASFVGLRQASWTQRMSLAVVPLLVLILNAPQYVRNVEFSGSPFGLSSPNGDDYERLNTGRPTPARVGANVLRNLGLHLGTKSPKVNTFMTDLLRGAIVRMGVDPDDPVNTWNRFRVNPYGHDEYFAGSLLHLILFCGVLLYVWLHRRVWSSTMLACTLGTVFAFLMFSSLYPWSVWGARLHTIPFVFATAVMGCVLERAWRPLLVGVLVAAGCLALTDALVNANRPLISRRDLISIFKQDRFTQYFVKGPWPQASFTAAIDVLLGTGCKDIGIDIEPSARDRFEYPMLKSLGADRGERRVWNVGVPNPSARLADSLAQKPPCAVLCLACAGNSEKLAAYVPRFPRYTSIDPFLIFAQVTIGSDGRKGGHCPFSSGL